MLSVRKEIERRHLPGRGDSTPALAMSVQLGKMSLSLPRVGASASSRDLSKARLHAVRYYLSKSWTKLFASTIRKLKKNFLTCGETRRSIDIYSRET